MDIKRTRPIHRGDIYYADLTPATGSEQGDILARLAGGKAVYHPFCGREPRKLRPAQ